MDWIDVEIEVNEADKENAAAILTMVTSSGIYIEDYSDLEEKVFEIAHVDLIEKELLNKPKNIVKIHFYISEEENIAEICELIQNKLYSAEISYKLNTKNVKQEDWENSWKKYYHSMEIGSRLAVVPQWEEYNNSEKRKIIKLDPGMAFGTGTHETTFLCLEFLDQIIKGGEKVLDVGCGSGILAIASVLLGAQEAQGIDIDPVAVRVAKENAEINKVQDNVVIEQGNLADKANHEYDVICANIIASAIIELSLNIVPLLKENGVFIASGIIIERKDEVLEALEKNGLKIKEIREKNNWAAIICGK